MRLSRRAFTGLLTALAIQPAGLAMAAPADGAVRKTAKKVLPLLKKRPYTLELLMKDVKNVPQERLAAALQYLLNLNHIDRWSGREAPSAVWHMEVDALQVESEKIVQAATYDKRPLSAIRAQLPKIPVDIFDPIILHLIDDGRLLLDDTSSKADPVVWLKPPRRHGG